MKSMPLKRVLRVLPFMLFLTVVVLAGCRHAHLPAARDVDYAMRWWNTLNAEQMVAALYGTEATSAQAAAAKMMYDDLDGVTKAKVNEAAAEIYTHGGHSSVIEWWESLDCRLMRIAAGDGNTADPSSAYCAHFPDYVPEGGKELSEAAQAHVRMVGTALLGLGYPSS